ncbi:ceramidase [Echria macrotheca]|uniref:Ceramidase n=1 Tax=Echria macrotheca TaxID=438768 RepID=A0AAJ0FAX8_9PEZI|nr:ceramidase [Echria macrotheca]
MSFMIEHNNLRLPPDRYTFSGAWSPPDSRANFCEEDYAITFYIAEFVNTLTNLAYIIPALQYMYPGGIFSRQKWDFMSLALLGLGIGSFLFHASLRAHLEFVDELSMLGLTWSMLQATYTTGSRSASSSRLISVLLTLFYVPFSVVYVLRPRIVMQVSAFLGALVLIGLRTHYLVHWSRPFPEAKVKNWTARSWKAVAVSLTGYLLWNLENMYCAELRRVKGAVGLPLAWLFEFHGWWHVLTAIGASWFIDVVREVRGAEETEEEKEKKKE